MKYELKQHFYIESARFLPNLPKSHPCANMHGHSFKIILSLIGEIDSKFGWVIDYHEISKVMTPILQQIDHKILNEVKGLENPTSELLAKWIFEKIIILIPILNTITIMETTTTECTYPVK